MSFLCCFGVVVWFGWILQVTFLILTLVLMYFSACHRPPQKAVRLINNLERGGGHVLLLLFPVNISCHRLAVSEKKYFLVSLTWVRQVISDGIWRLFLFYLSTKLSKSVYQWHSKWLKFNRAVMYTLAAS